MADKNIKKEDEPQKYILTIRDRILFPSFLPREGDFSDMIVKRDFLKKIAITQDELLKHKINRVGTDITWDCTDTFPYEFTALELAFLRRVFAEKNAKKQLTDESLPLYELFF